MGKTTGFLSQTSGKLDDNFQTRQTDHGTFLARNPRKTSKPRRSEKQANMRCQLPNASANYRLYNGKLAEAFENKSAGVNDFNSFVQVNYGKCSVFITRQESLAGGCVLGAYQFSRGSLPAVGIGLNQSGVLVSGIALGSLVIDANTTVADLAMAVLSQNSDQWAENDQITHFYAVQWQDSEGVPRATMQAEKVVLDLTDQTKLWEVVSARGFSSVNGYLGMNAALSNAGAAWVHSRNKSDGTTQVSTQRLTVVSDILESYQGYEAMIASANSYGGINSKSVYLNPTNSLAEVMAAGQNASNTSGGDNGNTGGESTETVAAPTISGNTSFTDSTEVTISGPQGAEIRYTTDGTTPTASSGSVYATAVTLTETATVKAIAIVDGVSSEVASKTFTKSSGGNGEGGDAE